MHTFYLICKKVIGIENYYENNIDIFSTLYTFSFLMFIQKTYSIQNKFKFLNEALENIFYTHAIKECFLNNFNKIQRTYNVFSRLAFLHKYKKAKIMVNTDLIMNEIKENDKYVFCLFQDNYKYLFNIHELVKIIHNSIGNSCHFFSNPKPIKNPYNNIMLKKSTLYNIYFFIKNKTILNAELFHYFFKTNFDLTKFVIKYQYLLRNFSIKNYLTNSTKNTICDIINSMIENYNSDVHFRKHQIIIDDTFPKDLLIKIMRPYLELYITSQYSLLYNDRIQCKKLLKKRLIAFNKFNPLFGRKIYKKPLNFFDIFNNSSTVATNTNRIYSFEYNSKHIDFFETEKNKDKTSFLDNHTSFNLIENDNLDDDDDDDIHDHNNSINSTTSSSSSSSSSSENDDDNNNDDNDDDNNNDDNDDDNNNDDNDDDITIF